MPRRASKKVELLEEIPGSATAGEVEVVESIENRDEEYEAMGVLPLRKFFKRAPPGEEPPNIATCNGKLLTVDASTDSKDGENLLFLPQKGPFLLVAELDMEADDGGINRRAVAKNGGETGFQAIIVQYAIGMDPEPQLWARDIHNRAWMLVEPTTEYKQMFDKAIQAATLVYGVLDLEDEFAEKRKVLEVKEVLFQYAMRTGSGLSRTAMEKLFASHAEEMITHCLGDDVTKGRAIVKFLKETFPDEFRRIHHLCNIHKKPMAKAIKYLETEADGDDEEEVEDPAVVPSVFYPPDHIMELAVNVKAMKKAENANLPCMPTPVVIYTYIVIHGISNCPTILYRDWSIARPETARYMVIYWAPKILEFMTDQTSEAYVELKALSQVCKPKDRADALAWVKRNNPGHERGRLGHDSEVTSEQRKRIPKPEWLQEGIAYDVIIHRQKPVDLWENFIFLQVRVPPEHRIRSAKKIVPKEDAARGPAFSSPTDEDVVMEDAAPDSTETQALPPPPPHPPLLPPTRSSPTKSPQTASTSVCSPTAHIIARARNAHSSSASQSPSRAISGCWTITRCMLDIK
ncbi:hypothetical protein B0J14DRAFT_273798 [Halenospora varia]|nr:hypothetical protein B0J14DRAFT_273798 [Halenospora varia]